MSTTTANMLLTVPAANDTDYPTSISSTCTAIDLHDHSSGKGVQIVTGGITDLAVTAAKLAANAVTTAKILDGNVTQAKRAALGQQLSTACGGYSTTSATYVDVTNLSVTITTTGRPVFIGLIADDAATSSYLGTGTAAGAASVSRFAILEGATTIAITELAGDDLTAIPVSSFSTIRVPSAGTYTYKVQAKLVGVGSAVVNNAKLIAYEL